jgi:hypothetical protein
VVLGFSLNLQGNWQDNPLIYCSTYSRCYPKGSYIRLISGQQLCKQVPAAAREMVLSMWSALRSHKKKRTGATSRLSSAREAENRWHYS